MKKVMGGIVALAALTLAIGQGRPDAQESPPKEDAPSTPQMREEDIKAMMEGMKKWMESIQPGKPHQALNPFVGEWETTTRMWMAGPGAPPTETKGISKIKWVLGNRFIMEEHKGQITLGGPPMPYEGIGLAGYDNVRNMYFSHWASTMGTQILTMKGAADPSGKAFRYYGEMDEPMLNVYGRTVKYVTTLVNDDKFTLEIIDLHAGDDYKVVEIVYNRKT